LVAILTEATIFALAVLALDDALEEDDLKRERNEDCVAGCARWRGPRGDENDIPFFWLMRWY